MQVYPVLLAVFAQAALTFALMFGMMVTRTRVLGDKSVHPRDIALGQPNWPEQPTKFANAFRNQFELPVLFYVLCILAIITRQADFLFVVLAWIFVAMRYIQAFIHVSYNRVIHRGGAYGLGAIVLVIMWVLLAIDVIFGL